MAAIQEKFLFGTDALEAWNGAYYAYRKREYYELSRIVTFFCLFMSDFCMHMRIFFYLIRH